MKYKPLGNSDLRVSEICLGTMNWGTQNSQSEAHAQMDYALDQGVNFFDTAELYPSNPLSAETQGSTEAIIGTWFKASGKRNQVILASKVAGSGHDYIQGGIDISAQKIRNSIEASLQRLQTDFIDLYQLHWPNRGSYHFRQSWTFDPGSQDSNRCQADMLECLQALDSLKSEGKIREVGLSNESCWGAMQYLQLAKDNSLPRVVSIQNEYSLMHRIYDLDLAEMSHHENVGLLSYSPLACGMLTGKYLSGNMPKGSRRTINPDLWGRVSDVSEAASQAYVDIAAKHRLNPTQMAVAFCLQRPFMASTIIGATSVDQLTISLAAAHISLNKEVMADIQAAYHKFPTPF
ncbi:MAG: aldo/keto reductase [Gammaproteobacteria bacterium]|nr:aldo/keto reductase [Gammaproteobacteria bacterium]